MWTINTALNAFNPLNTLYEWSCVKEGLGLEECPASLTPLIPQYPYPHSTLTSQWQTIMMIITAAVNQLNETQNMRTEKQGHTHNLNLNFKLNTAHLKLRRERDIDETVHKGIDLGWSNKVSHRFASTWNCHSGCPETVYFFIFLRAPEWENANAALSCRQTNRYFLKTIKHKILHLPHQVQTKSNTKRRWRAHKRNTGLLSRLTMRWSYICK